MLYSIAHEYSLNCFCGFMVRSMQTSKLRPYAERMLTNNRGRQMGICPSPAPSARQEPANRNVEEWTFILQNDIRKIQT